MNAIYTNQSTRENMDLLYAQARVYDRVKNWNRLNFLFSIIVPLLLSFGHCCKVSDEAAFCLIQRPYISKTLLTRRISPRGSP
ncbi:S-4TM family putative pore-forming effector [Klebsiella pneumoniae]|uniref:S-4TM family putative pore-forming effector n=1 Tax=Klebsiella pneumoniae TaxID=573 RepID=UPI0038BDA5C2